MATAVSQYSICKFLFQTISLTLAYRNRKVEEVKRMILNYYSLNKNALVLEILEKFSKGMLK